jgi:hypothetical protein
MNIIDMRMHMNFGDAQNAFSNGKDSDDSSTYSTGPATPPPARSEPKPPTSNNIFCTTRGAPCPCVSPVLIPRKPAAHSRSATRSRPRLALRVVSAAGRGAVSASWR